MPVGIMDLTRIIQEDSMKRIQFSADKLLDQIGKIGIMLVTGGIGGSIFSGTVSASMAATAVVIGLVLVIIGSISINMLSKEDD
jgi:hypothetical protein